jgi:hypothetical protein
MKHMRDLARISNIFTISTKTLQAYKPFHVTCVLSCIYCVIQEILAIALLRNGFFYEF